MITRFEIKQPTLGSNERKEWSKLHPPTVVPECNMCRLKPGDVISLRRMPHHSVYPEILSNIEGWAMRVLKVSYTISYYRDLVDGTSFYVPETVTSVQLVEVRILNHELW